MGKFWTPLKPIRISSSRKTGISRNGSVPQTPASTGVSLHDRQHLARHVDDDRVRVAVGQEPGERAAAAHPVAARVVDDDQVGAAGLGELRGEARAGAGADDRLARVDLGAQPRERLRRGSSRLLDQLVQAVGHRDRERRDRSRPSSSSCISTASPSDSRSAAEQRLVGVRGRGRAGPRRRSSRRPAAGRRAPSGPVAADSFRPIRRPSSAHSSGVVRISVTVGLWT